MTDEPKNQAPAEGPHGVDRWASNGYGLTVDGKEVTPLAKENEHEQDNDAEEYASDER